MGGGSGLQPESPWLWLRPGCASRTFEGGSGPVGWSWPGERVKTAHLHCTGAFQTRLAAARFVSCGAPRTTEKPIGSVHRQPLPRPHFDDNLVRVVLVQVVFQVRRCAVAAVAGDAVGPVRPGRDGRVRSTYRLALCAASSSFLSFLDFLTLVPNASAELGVCCADEGVRLSIPSPA